jgi:MFS transporter, DHA3 family, macrolide efflux protein
MAKLREIIKEPNFLFLWLGQIISQFGDKFAMMALVGLVYKKAPGSTYELAKLFVFIVVPVFLIGPIAGVYSDRWSRKWTMIISDIIRGLLVLGIVLYWRLVPTLQPVWPVYVIVFLLFSVTRFFIPAKMAIVPEILTEDKLLKGNSLMHTTGMIASALGFGLGGILVSLPSIGVRGGLVVDALTFFLSAVFVMLIKTKEKLSGTKESLYDIGRNVKDIIKRSVFYEIKHGIQHMLSQRRMHFVIILLFVLSSGVGASQVVMIVFIQNSLASITRDLGLLMMFFGTGLFLGALAYGKMGEAIPKIKVILSSLVLSGIFLIQFLVFVDLFANFWMAAAITFFFGAAISPIIISTNTIVHELIPEQAHGRVFSSLEAVMHLAYLAFMFLSAILAELVGSLYILLAVGIIFIAVGVIGIGRLKRE